MTSFDAETDPKPIIIIIKRDMKRSKTRLTAAETEHFLYEVQLTSYDNEPFDIFFILI